MIVQEGVAPYADSYAHLADVLRVLDLRLARAVAQARQLPALGQGGGAFISDAEIDLLLSPAFDATHAQEDAGAAALAMWHAHMNERATASIAAGVYLTLPHLAQLFALTWFELQVVVICLAPELRRKYDKIYAYLQNDLLAQKPSVDLVLELLGEDEAARWAHRALLTENARLLQSGILHMTEDRHYPAGSSSASKFLKLDARILDFLLGHATLSAPLRHMARVIQPSESLATLLVDSDARARAVRVVDAHFARADTNARGLVMALHGPPGVGKRALAEALCQHVQCPLLYVDATLHTTARHTAQEDHTHGWLRLALREALLLQAAIYVDGLDSLLCSDCQSGHCQSDVLAQMLAQAVQEYGWLTFLGSAQGWHKPELFAGCNFHSLAIPLPAAPLRAAIWQRALGEAGYFVTAARVGGGIVGDGIDDDGIDEVAERFRLTPRQIRNGVAALPDLAPELVPESASAVTMPMLYAAARSQSNQTLAALAQRIQPRYGWPALILPEDRLQQLRDLCAQVRGRRRVFDEWGFGTKIAYGRGVSALFAGKPGTGKTMTAEVIAGELGLELFKIDLSSVVSKYIGETEKNLSRIFAEAENSNAVLFFDEADALFGKRTEVSDAHDRYANIETSYLLQRMESYDGLVILATNLRDNLDEAFTRRIRFMIDFPFPDVSQRHDIWRAHIPDRAPLAADVDFSWLATHLPMAGGSIRNTILGAAFLAAETDSPIAIDHILAAARREYAKIGKLWEGITPPPAKSKAEKGKAESMQTNGVHVGSPP